MSSSSGKAKVLGTVICVVGTLILSLYKGVMLIDPSHGVVDERHVVRPKGLGPGAAFLVAGSTAWSSWFLIQSRIGHCFPHRYSSTSIMSLFSSIQSAVLCLIIDRNFSKWILEGELQIVAIIFSVSIVMGIDVFFNFSDIKFICMMAEYVFVLILCCLFRESWDLDYAMQ